jgi:Sec-independent protein translocase protein TatA
VFELGPEKLFLVLAAVFIFLGPKELPAAARKVGEMMRYLRSFQETLRTEVSGVLDPPHTVISGANEPGAHDSDHDVPPAQELEHDEPGFVGPSSFN